MEDARTSYPHLANIERSTPDSAAKTELSFALDEIDRLRSVATILDVRPPETF